MTDTSATGDSGTSPTEEVERLQQDYAQRLAAQRPMSHSVATAYKQLIARCSKADEAPSHKPQ